MTTTTQLREALNAVEPFEKAWNIIRDRQSRNILPNRENNYIAKNPVGYLRHSLDMTRGQTSAMDLIGQLIIEEATGDSWCLSTLLPYHRETETWGGYTTIIPYPEETCLPFSYAVNFTDINSEEAFNAFIHTEAQRLKQQLNQGTKITE